MSHATSHDTGSRLGPAAWIAIVIGAGILGYLIYYHVTAHHGGGHGDAHLPPWWGLGVAPFVMLLGSIAILPLLPWTHHWWENNRNRFLVAMACALLTLLYYGLFVGWERILPTLNHAIPTEYIPFIVLLFSLYVISGGISLKGDLSAHPMTNTAFIAFGMAIASFIGTTGASMLLIRPLLQTNSERKHVVHTVVFFIFLVSNIGGTLLPIGDPPLFLGYLRGVEFFWTMGLWKEWLLCGVILLIIYYIFDTIMYRREETKDIQLDKTQRQPLRLRGGINILWLAGVVVAVAAVVPGKPFPLLGFTVFPFLREIIMMALVGMSLITTPRGIREDNEFNYAAIIEVAALFVGIFITMQVPVEVLNIKGPSLGLTEPWHFFWATGSLSSVLDNAPTYVVFFETAKSLTPNEVEHTIIAPHLLTGISLGAVFMGAMTYIGNGPNFMVKAIAEQSGIRMPSFFGFVFRYSIPILVPVFILITVIFLRGNGHGTAPMTGAAPAHGDAAHQVDTPDEHTPSEH